MLAKICPINEPVNRALVEKRALRFLPRTLLRQDLPNQ
jgi:hypothetical protein